jgi:Asp/Glu/hydantoin racemase
MTDLRPLALFHSGAAHVATFTTLIAAIDPSIRLIHRVRQDLLEEAQPHGLTPSIRRAVAQEILDLADNGAGTVLCTCSTLGPGAESAAELTEVPVLRVDRPMLEAALDRGPRITIAAALRSTLGPTRTLLERVAATRGISPEIGELVVEGAWPLFEAGDRDAYVRCIAASLQARPPAGDAIVLAQASMADAADLLAGLGIPVLASPRIGAAAAVAAWRSGAIGP